MLLITIGRDAQNRIVINDPTNQVSSFHAEIKVDTLGNMTLFDKSMNGTFVNGQLVQNREVTIRRGDGIVFANATKLDWNRVPQAEQRDPNLIQTLSVGKNADNDIQYFSDRISRYHALIKVNKQNRVFIYDQSMNGTFVNGNRISSYTDFPVKRTDSVSFANAEALDWKRVPKAGLQLGGGGIRGRYILVPLLVLVLGLLGYAGYRYRSGSFDPNDYTESVVMLYHSFVYKVDLPKGPIYITKNQNGFAVYKDGAGPIESTGTGFFVSTDGKIITNRHVALPWEYTDDDIRTLTAALNEKGIYGFTITGETVYLGYVLDNTFVSSISDFSRCQRIREGATKEIDVALIQTNTKETPAKVKHIVDLDNAITDKEDLKPGVKLVSIGYPLGFRLAATKQGIRSHIENGQITRQSDGVRLSHNITSQHGASGSPIFDEAGHLVAVLNAGIDTSQGFNFGIIAAHAKNLLTE